jgi:hypothetical protein
MLLVYAATIVYLPQKSNISIVSEYFVVKVKILKSEKYLHFCIHIDVLFQGAKMSVFRVCVFKLGTSTHYT